MPPDFLGPALLVLGAVLVVGLVARGVRRVPADERLVLVRAGRFDERSLRGPGLVLLIPFIDRGVRVSLSPQHFALDAVPATSADGCGVLVDLDIRFRVVDPVAFVTNVLPPPAGLRALARGALQEVLRTAAPGNALFPGDVENQITPLMESGLAMGGVRDIALRVTRVRPGSVEGADEAEFQTFLRQEGIKAPSRTKRKR